MRYCSCKLFGPLLLSLRLLCACFPVFPSCVGIVGVNNCDETLDSVPNTVVAPVRARNNGASATSFLESTWEWCGVMVPVIREFWQGHVMATTMVFLL